MVNFRSVTTTNTSTNIKTTGADVTSLNIVNRHNAAIFVKFYNSPVATFQDTPIATFQVAATSPLNLPINGPFQAQALFSSSSGLCVRVVTGSTDSDNTAAATLPIIEIGYN